MNFRSKMLLSIIFVIPTIFLFAQEYAVGADVSFVKYEEDNGRVFKDGLRCDKCLHILKAHNFNWVRLRLFYSPTQLPNSLSYTIASAKEAKALGFKFLLDLHYSDTWADPQHQTPPAAWQHLSRKQLVDSVYCYTKRIMTAFEKENVMPDMVQIGNEIANGFLWPIGLLPQNYDSFCELLQAGITGATSIGHQPPEILLHLETGADFKRSEMFFDTIITHGIRFDVIGLSYYPWWQGSLAALTQNVHRLAVKYDKKIIIVETAYNHKKKQFSKRKAPYPETEDGQKAFVQSVDSIVRAIPNGKGCGMFWWEPTYKKGFGNLFDKRGRSLPVISSFDRKN